MANDQTRKATMQLYSSFWKNNEPESAITVSVRHLSEGYEKAMTTATYRFYVAALSDLTQEQIVLAFARATEECKAYFPSPATLREYSGRSVSGDPIAAEAKAEMLKLIAGMRTKHGPMLKPILGPVLYGTNDDPKDKEGNGVEAPIRGESTHFPIARRTEAALVRLGWGDRTAGISLIAEHPALKRTDSLAVAVDPQYRQNQVRASDEILKRFTDTYREV